ncbi:hypothetical protein BDV59DRAFT_167397 [Aspergillus ambiguus]|uniref:uncharacterized protein n=1 Tax=Aspergillus ambiguus TaxID=176160 RepID=UPI003CCDDE67
MPVLPQVQKSWSKDLQTPEGHSDSLISVAFSPDGQRIVSGSRAPNRMSFASLGQ